MTSIVSYIIGDRGDEVDDGDGDTSLEIEDFK
jgi:hypothetical protein